MKSIHWLHYWGYLSQIISRESILGRAKVGAVADHGVVHCSGKDLEIGGARLSWCCWYYELRFESCPFSVRPSRP